MNVWISFFCQTQKEMFIRMSESLFSMQWKWKGIFTVKPQKSIKALKSYHNINPYISCTIFYKSSEVIWLCEDIWGVIRRKSSQHFSSLFFLFLMIKVGGKKMEREDFQWLKIATWCHEKTYLFRNIRNIKLASLDHIFQVKCVPSGFKFNYY